MPIAASPVFTHRTACPLCRSTTHSVFIDFADIPVLKCSSCHLLYAGKVLKVADLHSYYHLFRHSPRHLKGQMINARINLVALCKLIDLTHVNSLLDIGTGYGFLLKGLSDRYRLTCKGVELSKAAARFASQNLKQDVFCGPLPEASIPLESFDVVTSFEVIEHVPDPTDFIAQMAKYLKPDGKLVIMTDNFASWPCTSLGAAFPKWIPHSHVSHFTPETLKFCIESVGDLHVQEWLSFTPWELLARTMANLFYSQKAVTNCFNLTHALRDEMTRKYTLFRLRQIVNPIWLHLTCRRDTSGALMYALAKQGRLETS